METNPSIYSVLEFRINEQGERFAYEHLVAGCDSFGAELAFIRGFTGFYREASSAAEFFIQTEMLKDHYTHPDVRFYVKGTETSRPKGDAIDDVSHANWIDAMTNASYEDGDHYPAAFRRMDVDKARIKTLETEDSNARAARIPDELRAAVDRMCAPLDPSWLSGVTAQEDARCMKIIRDHILGVGASGSSALQTTNDPNLSLVENCGGKTTEAIQKKLVSRVRLF